MVSWRPTETYNTTFDLNQGHAAPYHLSVEESPSGLALLYRMGPGAPCSYCLIVQGVRRQRGYFWKTAYSEKVWKQISWHCHVSFADRWFNMLRNVKPNANGSRRCLDSMQLAIENV